LQGELEELHTTNSAIVSSHASMSENGLNNLGIEVKDEAAKVIKLRFNVWGSATPTDQWIPQP